MRTVFIPQLPTRLDKATGALVPAIDVNPASAFGNLTILFSSDVPRSQAIAEVAARSREIGPADYILAVGDVALLALAVVHAVLRNGSATLLRWDSESRTYRTEGVMI